MQFIKKEGVTLAYKDVNPGSPPMVFVHGCGFDHTSFALQAKFFSRLHRVVLVDLRGHGRSDAPLQDYTMAAFADDLTPNVGDSNSSLDNSRPASKRTES